MSTARGAARPCSHDVVNIRAGQSHGVLWARTFRDDGDGNAAPCSRNAGAVISSSGACHAAVTRGGALSDQTGERQNAATSLCNWAARRDIAHLRCPALCRRVRLHVRRRAAAREPSGRLRHLLPLRRQLRLRSLQRMHARTAASTRQRATRVARTHPSDQRDSPGRANHVGPGAPTAMRPRSGSAGVQALSAGLPRRRPPPRLPDHRKRGVRPAPFTALRWSST